MTFSMQVKTELAGVNVERDCCLKAETYGMLLFARSFSASRILLQTENRLAAQRFQNFVKKICGVRLILTESASGVCKAEVTEPADCLRILDTFGHVPRETALHINRANLEEECCMQAFLRGAFLSCGSIVDPAREYHLEFLMPRRQLTGDLVSLMNELSVFASQTVRKGAGLVYLKGSEPIEELLTHMGAVNSTLQLMNVKIYKDFRNVANRRSNCETANLSRTVDAAHQQTLDIEFLSACGEFEKLPARLREAAILRRDHPELSLSELGAIAVPPMSRSGINHRLQKITELAAELRAKRTGKG